jgi:ABC-type antimicrobial peptide transport system permease subunit
MNLFYNFKIMLRNLQRGRIYSAINIGGLAVSLTACILIMLWVQDELSYDRFHRRANDIYIAATHMVIDGVDNHWYASVPPLARAAKENIAGVEAACAVEYARIGYLEYNLEKFFGGKYMSVDTSFFRIFDATFLEGSPHLAFAEPKSIVITDELANKLFGKESAFGKPVKSDFGESYTVSAVVKKMPKNSVLQFEALLSMELSPYKDDWERLGSRTYLLLNPQTDIALLGEQLMKANPDYYNEENREYYRPYELHPIYHYLLYNADGSESGMKYVKMFSLTAFIILIIACVNYMNLVTARSEKRRKEISMRKLLGASRKQLFFRILSEAALLFVIATVIATLFVYLLNPLYNSLAGKQLDFTLFNAQTLLLYVGTFILVCLLAGIYPSVVLASFHPKEALSALPKGKKTFFSFRRLLVVLQFACTVAFILSAIVLNRQLHFMRTKDPGYDREQVFFMDIRTNNSMANHYESFKFDLEQHSAISGVSAADENIMEISRITSWLSWEGMEDGRSVTMNFFGVTQDLISLFNISLVEGEGFLGTSTDTTRFLLNQAAVRLMGIQNPAGKWFDFMGTRGVIAGVVKDFNSLHLSKEIQPLVITYWPNGYKNMNYQQIYVKTAPGKIAEALAEAEKSWRKFDPDTPFSYMFLDAKFDEMYKSDILTGNLFNIFAMIAILISCLGLFGLVTFMAETKTKEIGIRKVLGAKVSDIVAMLSKEFILLVGIAMLIAFPLAYYGLDRMLQDYANRIDISWWMLALAGGITVVLTVLTVGWQAVKAATTNPVEAISNCE